MCDEWKRAHVGVNNVHSFVSMSHLDQPLDGLLVHVAAVVVAVMLVAVFMVMMVVAIVVLVMFVVVVIVMVFMSFMFMSMVLMAFNLFSEVVMGMVVVIMLTSLNSAKSGAADSQQEYCHTEGSQRGFRTSH